jgi:hypothetical protein
MRHIRRAARVDNNQKEIVEALRQIPSVSVEVGHDDCLVGFEGKTYWFEIKDKRALNKEGKVREGEKQKSQKRLSETWKGHYQIVSSLDEILKTLKLRC